MAGKLTPDPRTSPAGGMLGPDQWTQDIWTNTGSPPHVSIDPAALHRALQMGQLGQAATAASKGKQPATQLGITIKFVENGYLVVCRGKEWIAPNLEDVASRITALIAAEQMDSKD